MDTQFNITHRFEKDLTHFSKENQQRITHSIHQYTPSFDTKQGDPTHHIYQPYKIQLPEGLDSSLYVLRSTPQISVLLSIENDPLVARKLITLFRAVKQDELDRAFHSLAHSLYQHLHIPTSQ
jgi:hypothetical protein